MASVNSNFRKQFGLIPKLPSTELGPKDLRKVYSEFSRFLQRTNKRILNTSSVLHRKYDLTVNFKVREKC
jgi:hypothetical protein